MFDARGKAVSTSGLTDWTTGCGRCTFGRNAHDWNPVLILCVSVMHFDRQVAVPQLMNNIAEDIPSAALVCCFFWLSFGSSCSAFVCLVSRLLRALLGLLDLLLCGFCEKASPPLVHWRSCMQATMMYHSMQQSLVR